MGKEKKIEETVEEVVVEEPQVEEATEKECKCIGGPNTPGCTCL